MSGFLERIMLLMDDLFLDIVRESGFDVNMMLIGCYYNSLNFCFNYNIFFKRNINKFVCFIFWILISGIVFGKLLIMILFNCY